MDDERMRHELAAIVQVEYDAPLEDVLKHTLNVINAAASPPLEIPPQPQPSREHAPCTRCGTTDTPKWRLGSSVCNACGMKMGRERKEAAETLLLLHSQQEVERASTAVP